MVNMTYLAISIALAFIVTTAVCYELYATKRKRLKIRNQVAIDTELLPTVCAGSTKKDLPIKASEKVVSLKYNSFTDDNGVKLNISDYSAYIFAGNSMQFCDINEGDLLLVSKAFNPKELSELPAVIVLSDPKPDMTLSQFKLRRAWRICSDQLTDEEFEKILREILELDAFKQLKRELAEKGFSRSDEELINDFFKKGGRLERYRDKYKTTQSQQIVISTTFDTGEEEIHFSIHQLTKVVGVKKYVYDVSKPTHSL